MCNMIINDYFFYISKNRFLFTLLTLYNHSIASLYCIILLHHFEAK